MLLLSVIVVSLSFAPIGYYSVRYVFDGDTIILGNGEKLRYLGIDAPEMGHQGEKGEMMALESRDFNMRLVGGSLVRLEFDSEKRDQYGRLLAYLFLENGDMINGLLVRNGLARVMVKRPNLKYFHILLEYQRQAMSEGLGAWKSLGADTEKYYLGSSKSYRFHRPGCKYAARILPKNLVKFESRNKAFWEGFSPGKACRP